jgi:signal transduction histidine kinase/serine phosphatase RsbU (regulator of sigma subunit)/DNA-binding response OmpR family regulator
VHTCEQVEKVGTVRENGEVETDRGRVGSQEGLAGVPHLALFARAGQVGRDLAAVDWERTPLGQPESWPQSLTAAVTIVLSSRFAMWMAWGPDLTFLCNETYRRDTLGAKYPWALGRPAREVWQEIWSDIGPRIDTVMATGKASWDEDLLLFLERSGYVEETYHTFSYSPLRDDSGAITGMLCVVNEDTERVISERRLSTLRDLGIRLATARTESDVVARAVDSLNQDQRSLPATWIYLFTEDRGTAVLTASTGPLGADPVEDRVIDLNDPGGSWPVRELLDGRTTQVDLSAVTPNGTVSGEVRQALAVPLVSHGQDRPIGFIVVGLSPFRPFDENYRSFVELLAGQFSAGLVSARAYDAERRRAEMLAELDRAKTTFFTNVSHELRTPLTLLLGPAEDALADRVAPLPMPQRERVEIIRRNSHRLLKLVNTLLDFSRLEAGQVDVRFERSDLKTATSELVSMFDSATRDAGLELAFFADDSDHEAYVDRDAWSKIVSNLMSNALKFTFEGAIRVSLQKRDGQILLEVADTGIGIAPEEQDRLFGRFQQVRGARSRSHEGSGIGLALVAELVALHGGTVGVTSEPGHGSTFRVCLPTGFAHLPPGQVDHQGQSGGEGAGDRLVEGFVAEAVRWTADAQTADQRGTDPQPAEAQTADRRAGDGPEGETGAGQESSMGDSRPRVLVVDDNADMRSYISGLLAGDYVVDTAVDGRSALELVRSRPPDLVLTDVMMPGLDGFGLLAALHADRATVAVPVIMVSARAGDGAAAEGLESGADDYLVKPFTARELLARVRANLELDRVRRTQAYLERSQTLLDQAERLAQVGSWDVQVSTGALNGSDELFRILHLDPGSPVDRSLSGALRVVHPEDRERGLAAIATMVEGGPPLDQELRLAPGPDGVRIVRVRAVCEQGEHGAVLRGSLQDVTAQRRIEEMARVAAAAQEVAAREHHIAEELQRSLLPVLRFDPDQLEVATVYRAGVEGTQVGGDWYDVIELGAGRTALVLGDVMGRGVHAAAVMGQLRSALRAYAHLDLPPAEILGHLDVTVRDLGEDQIVTCVYAVYDPADGALTYANAGHLPPLLEAPGSGPVRLDGSSGPPLGTGPSVWTEETRVLPPGSRLTLYTDGLVERRDEDLDHGIGRLADHLARLTVPIADIPHELVRTLVPQGVDDDIAILVAQTPFASPAPALSWAVDSTPAAVKDARHFVASALEMWAVPPAVADGVVLASDELITNAVLHGNPQVSLRLRRTESSLFVEVHDGARVLPQRMQVGDDSEHGRGLEIVEVLAQSWGTRYLPRGKAVWCRFSLSVTAPRHG